MTDATGRPKAILWDFDGTLVDTEPVWERMRRRLCDAHGVTYDEALDAVLIGASIGDSAAVMSSFIATHGGPRLGVDETADWMIEDVLSELRTMPTFPWCPGAKHLIGELNKAGIPCALVSASEHIMLDTLLGRLPEHPFRVVIGGDDVEKGKPDPEGYRKAAADLGFAPSECLVLEDSLIGATAGRASGSPVLALGPLHDPRPGQFVVASLKDVDLDMVGRAWRTARASVGASRD